ncbi:phosphatase PAP2 family protein [Bradyrhizobium sp. Y36]|uniref:phosphatase PAP2 family protein n=1 Tax=Bradyrhizobium sp. Y36 TaxID=2035447 RepID=UPI001FDEAD70|nr:phosphatase PAP2 family protein [Bradyrhizobium sp. Y36]
MTAASAVLCMWTPWPVRGLCGISAALNLLMIVATPVIGAHGIIDVAAGIALAAASIWVATFHPGRTGKHHPRHSKG